MVPARDEGFGRTPAPNIKYFLSVVYYDILGVFNSREVGGGLILRRGDSGFNFILIENNLHSATKVLKP